MKDAPVVVIGEALVDLIVDEHLSVDAHLGGGPFNVARTIARLGQPVTFLGALSRDRFGNSLRATLESDGVALHRDLATDLPTTLAMVSLDEKGVAQYEFYAAGTSAPSLEPAQLEAAMPSAPHSLHVGGLGLVFEPSASAVLALIEQPRGAALLSVDPNSRPHAISDLDAHRRIVRRATACADILKFSDEDAGVLAPDAPPEATARELRSAGPGLVILTRGARGALALGQGYEFEIPAPTVEVVDTVGAGDAFSGALLADLKRRGLGRDDLADEAQLHEAVEFAINVSALVCERAGADPPHLAEVPAAAGPR